MKLEPVGKGKIKAKRKPLSTPASPSRAREPQCTCMTPEQYARIRSQDPRYRGMLIFDKSSQQLCLLSLEDFSLL